jgi:thioredoxin 1
MSNIKIEYFGAPWCSACKVVKPIVESLEGFEKEIIDVEEETDRAVSLSIRSIPVVRLVKDGEEIKRFIGNTSKQEIETYLELI